jgi:hypothetical protein
MCSHLHRPILHRDIETIETSAREPNRYSRRLATSIIVLLLVPTALATIGSNPGAAHPELYKFDTFLDGHENVAAVLVSTPALISSEGFLAKEPELAAFFQQYPEAQKELLSRPDVFRNREQRFRAANSGGVRVTRTAIDWFDQYLTGLPQLEEILRRTPDQVDAADTLTQYRELQQFLDSNPGFVAAFKLHPAVFFARPDFFANKPGKPKSP